MAVKINHAGMRALLKSDKVRDLLMPRAERVLAAAIADPHDDTGDYENGLGIEVVMHPSRVVVQVVAKDWKSHILEAKYGILSRARDAAR